MRLKFKAGPGDDSCNSVIYLLERVPGLPTLLLPGALGLCSLWSPHEALLPPPYFPKSKPQPRGLVPGI